MKKNIKINLTIVIVLTLVVSLSAQNIWLNEFHYDNVSTDEGEFVEIVLEEIPGNLLSDYTVTFYNGNNGSEYDSITLDQFSAGSTIDDFVILYYYKEGIQNGAPDGIAIDYQGTLIPGQFLSYEGTFEALDGPANGVTSTDVDVEEGSSTQIGESLQLFGSGAIYSDFVWQAPAIETPGELNNGQTIGGTPEPAIIVASPNGGEEWEQGSTHPITWTSMNFTGNIKIELEMVWRDREVLVASTEDDGSWEWNIPIDLAISEWYSIIISDAEDGDPWDDSNAAFSIIEPIPVTPYSIYDIQYSTSGPSPHEGELVETSGVVTAIFEYYFFIQDGEGAWNGITIYPLQEVEVGDEITISGVVLEYNDKTEITDIIDMTISGTANLPQAVTVSTNEVATSEEYESVLVKTQNVTVTAEPNSYDEWEIDDTSGTCVVGVQGNYTYIPVLNDMIYSVKGIVDFAFGSFKLEPRDDNDISLQGLTVDPVVLNFFTIESCDDGLEFTITNLSSTAIELISIEDTGMFPVCGNPWFIEDFNLTFPYNLESSETLVFNVMVEFIVNNNREIVSDILEIENELGIIEITLNFETDLNSDAENNLINTSSELISNYPNPFNPETTIQFNIEQDEQIKSIEIEIYNLKGQIVDQLQITDCKLGMNEITWNAEGLSSGMYFYNLLVDDKKVASQKLILMK